MTNDSTPNFEIPHEMRQLVQLSLEQAQKAVNDSIAAGHKVAAAMEGRTEIAQIQPDFVKAQTATLREQAKELGQTMA